MKKSTRLVAAVGAVAALVLAPAAAANAATIDSPGPLVQIGISETLNCSVNHVGDDYGEFFGDTACGTFLAVGDDVYGPSEVPAGSLARNAVWTPVSQSQDGSGSAADPFSIDTVVSGNGVTVSQQDTYVSGEHSYDTTSTVTNTTEADLEITIYHAADCYLGDNDYGFGAFDPATGAVNCAAPDAAGEHSSASRIVQFIPHTDGSNFIYSGYYQVWEAVGSGDPLPDLLDRADERIDNGMGLSWTVTIPAGESASFGLRTNFSPLEVDELNTNLVIDPASVLIDGSALVTATVNNPNSGAQDLTSATITLPDGLVYVSDSTNGLEEPTVNASNQLVFDGDRAVIAGESSFSFTFQVVGNTVGSFEIGLTAGVESRVDVAPSSAVLTVERAVLPSALSLAPDSVTVGDDSKITATFSNPYGVDFELDSATLLLAEDVSYVAGSAAGIDEPTVSGNTLTFAGPITVGASGSVTFSVNVTTEAAGAQAFTLSGTSARADVLDSVASLSVVAPTAPSTPEKPKAEQLASTGAEGGIAFGVIGGALLLAGAAVLGARNVRRRA